MPTLPTAALMNMPFKATNHLREEITPVSFTTLYYSIGRDTVADLWEIDDRTWVERTASGENHTYRELHESPNRVVLYDESRDSTIIIDWKTYGLTVIDDDVSTLHYVEDFGHSYRPQTLPDWWYS